MVLPIIMYGHPVLRQKGAAIESITPDITTLIQDMLETMQEKRGIGLAAQQIGRALQLTVIDVQEITERPSWIERGGKRVDVDEFMPLVLINPSVSPAGPPETDAEGCLSFPDMYTDITRPGVIDVSAQDSQGHPIKFRCGDLLARAVQHEVDHLNGILFIDRMTSDDKSDFQLELDDLQAQTKAALQKEV